MELNNVVKLAKQAAAIGYKIYYNLGFYAIFNAIYIYILKVRISR